MRITYDPRADALAIELRDVPVARTCEVADASIFSRLPISRGTLVGIGVVYALAVFVVMWFLVVPAIDPVMLKLNGMVFAIAHMMWGRPWG